MIENRSRQYFVGLATAGQDAACTFFGLSVAELVWEIQSLEAIVGFGLINYDRVAKRITITNAGLTFLPYLKKSNDTFQEGIVRAQDVNLYEMDNELTLAVARDSAATWALACVKNLNKIQPGLKLSILADDYISGQTRSMSTVIFRCLQPGDLDNFERYWYIEYPYALFASDLYIERYGEPTIENIKSHRIIAYSGQEKYTTYKNGNWHLFGEYSLPKLEPSVFSTSLELIVKMVSSGVGIGSVCETQEHFYGYTNLRRVLKHVSGPVLRSYFAVKNGISEQMYCNVSLVNSLFMAHFEKKGIQIFKETNRICI
jgi:DNA-binding transcriptional LysR family regulator